MIALCMPLVSGICKSVSEVMEAGRQKPGTLILTGSELPAYQKPLDSQGKELALVLQPQWWVLRNPAEEPEEGCELSLHDVAAWLSTRSPK